ncbi:transcriptional regulator [Halomicroarcula sp. GCM10025709]|uniref:DUF7344 domain-containing protein n=1 Tax=Haloarcula TaxID=2237 RepID=UPI0024C2A6C1|nr:hypothetical protein [Halomicroarcula sp. YJ-61-S]
MTDQHTWPTLFESLRARARRRLLTALSTQEQMATTQLTEALATETSVEAISQTEWVHIHLPILAEADYIDWDRDAGTISQGPRFDEIQAVLAFVQTESEVLPDGWV